MGDVKMAKQAPILFLEEWLKTNSGANSVGTFSDRDSSSSSSSSSSARAIIQAWAELRNSLQHQSFQSHHLQSLKTLVNSKSSLHVADPQAKILISILSSPNISISYEAYPLSLRLLYIWVRKSSRPSSFLIDSAVNVVSQLFSSQFNAKKSSTLFSESVLLLGALSSVSDVSENSKRICLDWICELLEKEHKLMSSSSSNLIPNVLAGIGYALFSSDNAHFVRISVSLLEIWGNEEGLLGNVSNGLMILHLMDWVFSGLIKFHSVGKMELFSREILGSSNRNFVSFAIFMAAAGVLKSATKPVSAGNMMETVYKLRNYAEEKIDAVAKTLIYKIQNFSYLDADPENHLLLQCMSLALARIGPVSSKPSLFLCLASAFLTEIFPLERFYKLVFESSHDLHEVKDHLGSALFKEAGSITSVFCNLYVAVDEEKKNIVERLIWKYCYDIYAAHRQVALVLRGGENELLSDLEKIAESAFLMVVFFALAVTKHRLNLNLTRENQMDISVKILVSFSCMEYFRRMRLPEYMDTIRGAIVSVQENESACISFVESMPSYADLTNQQGFSCFQKMEYTWSEDEVQTARILFYLRVIPTCIERVPPPVFRNLMAPTTFLYMGHPNVKVARASHAIFVAFISSGKDPNQEERVALKEQLVFYYMQRSLQGYPGITPFDGMATGVAALVRHLPAGSPSIFYCIHSLVEKANSLCSEVLTHEADLWKNWQGESEPCKKILELLLRLISLVDIQVLPNLMKLLAQLIIQLPKDGKDMVLNDLYSQVAESDDVTRKPTLVSWLQSLSYLTSQVSIRTATSMMKNGETLNPPTEPLLNARL